MHNAMGCCGTALQWEANFGARMGAMIASDEAPLRRLQEFRFKQDFYRGRPWFLPFVGSCYQVSTSGDEAARTALELIRALLDCS